MKTLIRITFLLSVMLLATSCFMTKKLEKPNVTVSPLNDAASIKDGSIVYGLPRSVFTVVAEMERTIEIPGPYARYAGDLLGLEKVINNENEFWTIEGITVQTTEELDPSEFYIIESNSVFQTNVLRLKNEGLILDLNSDRFDADNRVGLDRRGSRQFQSFDLGSDEYFLMQRDTVYKRVAVDSAFIRIPYIVEKKKKLTPDQLAEKAARRLMEMRDGKHLILTGEANVFPQSDAAINEMNRLEKEYLELFAGKTIKERRTFTGHLIPLKDMIGKQVVLFQFSDKTGPMTSTAKGGLSVNIEFDPEKKIKELTIVSRPASETESGTVLNDKIYYRVPDIVNVKISLGTETLLNTRKLIYQFGNVVQLPANYIIGK
jgi:hypothetical protein